MGFGEWAEQVIIRLISASTGVVVEVGDELGKSCRHFEPPQLV